MNPSNVLVIGAPRSGTTLVGGLICAKEKSFPMIPECTYITQIIKHYHDIINYSDPQRFAAYAINEEILTGMYTRMVRDMISTVLTHFEGMSHHYLVLKDPELSLFTDLIPLFFGEDSKVVCVIRDPRAVIASMIKVNNSKRNQLVQEELIINKIFNYYYRVHTSNLYMCGAVHTVRYENIVARAENEFLGLEAFLGFSVGREGFGKIYFDFDRESPFFSKNYDKAIQTPTSDFKSTLTAGQVVKIETAFSGFNAKYAWW